MACSTCGKRTNVIQKALPMPKQTNKLMANENNPVILCWRGKQRWPYHYSVLIGSFLDRIEKSMGKIEVDDPDLLTKLTPEQLKTLSVNFPHLDPDRPLPIAPPVEDIEFRIPTISLDGGDTSGTFPIIEEPKEAAKRGRKPKTT